MPPELAIEPQNLVEAGLTTRTSLSAEESNDCICCGKSQWQPKYRILAECAHCHFIRAAMNVTPEQINELYQEDYFRGSEYGNYLDDQATHRTNFAWRYRMVRDLAPELKSIFEIGCAYGFWLECCSQHQLRAAGVDVCDVAVQYAQSELRQDARSGDFLTLDLEKGGFDAYCMWDTIEHLANPEDFVSRVYDLLPPGGWLFLTTGDIGSRVARFRGRHWRMIHPPTHLQYYSTDSMRRFLDRHGFDTVRCQSQSMYRNIGEVLERVGTLGHGVTRWTAKALSRVTPTAIKRRGFWIDMGDIMFVAARRRAL
jgi:SAM-dependent methyltransferase